MAADAAIGSKITQALKAGSGVDINELSTNLAEAESMSGINAVTKKIESSRVALSGMGVLKAGVLTLKNSFEALEDKDTLLTKAVFSQNTNRISAQLTSGSLAIAGTNQLTVYTLARSTQQVIQRFTGASPAIADFTSLTQQLNGGTAINYTLVIGAPGDTTSTAINGVADTPQGLIDAINTRTSTTGITAKAVNMAATGGTFRIFLSGKTGIINRFDLTGHQTSNTTNHLSKATPKSAVDLKVSLNGTTDIFRSTNSPTDVIEGVQLNIKAANNTATTNIIVSESTESLKTALDSVIASYNDFLTLADYLTGESDEEDELAGSLSKEKSNVNLAMNALRGTINQVSATASNGFSTLRDIGISTKLGGKLSLNLTDYAAALKSNFADIRTMLTGDTNGQNAFSTQDHGLALDIGILMEAVAGDAGAIKQKETSTIAKKVKYEEQLVKLNERLEGIKARYMKQFTAMESLVQRSKNTGEYLTSQFEAMQNSNR